MLLATHRPQQAANQAMVAPRAQSVVSQDVVDSLRHRIMELEFDVRRERADADGLRRKLAASEGTREERTWTGGCGKHSARGTAERSGA